MIVSRRQQPAFSSAVTHPLFVSPRLSVRTPIRAPFRYPGLVQELRDLGGLTAAGFSDDNYGLVKRETVGGARTRNHIKKGARGRSGEG